MGGDPAGAAPDSSQYADGMRAIRESRWNDAESIFDRVAKEQGSHAAGALYWKAYAQEKGGQSKLALDTCVELRHSRPSSSWIEECGALEIEIRAKNNLPVPSNPTQSDEVKLLALNSLMNKNEPRALEEIAAILNGDSSEQLKQGALFILGNHHDDVTYPQIVRLSYVEGDVRIARGLRNGHAGGAEWEEATGGLPLETGFTLATGAGRAEIEFENASTVYLGENSVLMLNDLHTTVGAPYTEVALLTGTVSLFIRPMVDHEVFLLKTPTDTVVLRYPDNARFRVDSYLDGVGVTPLADGVLRTPGGAQQELVRGKTLYYRDGQPIEYAGAKDSAAVGGWDQWVAKRSADHYAAVAAVMKVAKLTKPIPGLAGMADQGTFFDCAPYGTCWEPTGASVQQAFGQSDPALPQTAEPAIAQETGQSGATGNDGSSLSLHDSYFPCAPEQTVPPAGKGAATGKMLATATGYWRDEVPYAWAVCHAGAWIHLRNHYVWVAGERRHYHPPFRWIKSGHTVAYVPLHPHDVKDHPPINRKAEVFALREGEGHRFERTQLDSGQRIELLKNPPKGFREQPVPMLARAEEPHLVANQLRDALVGKNAVVRAGGVPIYLDARSRNFVMSREVTEGHRSATMVAPINNRGGDLQSHAASYGGGARSFGNSGGGSGGSHAGTTISTSTSSSAGTAGTNTAPSWGTGVTTNGPSSGKASH
jgi:hypothetical protein